MGEGIKGLSELVPMLLIEAESKSYIPELLHTNPRPSVIHTNKIEDIFGSYVKTVTSLTDDSY